MGHGGAKAPPYEFLRAPDLESRSPNLRVDLPDRLDDGVQRCTRSHCGSGHRGVRSVVATNADRAALHPIQLAQDLRLLLLQLLSNPGKLYLERGIVVLLRECPRPVLR